MDKLMKESKLFEEILRESNNFNINTPISSSKDCIDAFWYIEDQISIMANELIRLITNSSMREQYSIKESLTDILHDYKQTTETINLANNRVDEIIGKLRIYLKQRPDEEVQDLNPSKEDINDEVNLVDKRILRYQSGIKPDISFYCNIFYKTIEKFNGIIDDFNTHNQKINPNRKNEIEHEKKNKNYIPSYT
jgi:hypothetical protein